MSVDRAFWQSIVDSEYKLPEGHAVEPLTEELLSYLGSTDPQLRDTFAYFILGNWIFQGRYRPKQLRAMLSQVAGNLTVGLGEVQADSVFLRSFSILLLDAIVSYDTVQPYLTQEEVRQVLELALVYLSAERDLRGWVPEKGWAHAVAHTADLLATLAASVHLDGPQLQRILDAIAMHVTASTIYPYLADEDERLARTVISVLQRGLVPAEYASVWLHRLSQPEGQSDWADRTAEGMDLAACHNTKQLLRGLYLRLAGNETLAPLAAMLLPEIQAGLRLMSPDD